MKNQKILLVEPNFPFPNKSKNSANSVHKNFVPLGLLKLGAYYKDQGTKNIKLVRGEKSLEEIGFKPDKVLVTSLFTYWSNHVWKSIEHYRTLFPKSTIELGGVYATLHYGKEKFDGLAKKYGVDVVVGVHPKAEEFYPDYSLIPEIDYHGTHMMRGCIRKCSFCGTWKIEPKIIHKETERIINEILTIGKNKVIFYDNNLLANPFVENTLKEFNTLRVNGKPVIFESQSGFDGRILEKKPHLGKLLKDARFQNVRIAWDNGLDDKKSIKKQIDILTNAGYYPKDISVFMIYNFDLPYEAMLKKVKACYNWGVQITDCRNRPLDLDYDNYSPHKVNGQPEGSFYIHKKSGWSDKKIRDFRKNVRQHNIEIRYAKDKGARYDPKMEKWSAIHNLYKFFKLGRPPQMVVIENNKKIKDRIEYLKRLMGYHKKLKIPAPDLSELSELQIDRILKELFKLKEDKSISKDYLYSIMSGAYAQS